MRRQRDWQKSDPHLRDHPAFTRFRSTLGVSANEAHGILAGLWAFAFKFAQDGNLSRFAPEDIALAIDYGGDANALIEALGLYFVCNDRLKSWEEWGGALFSEQAWETSRKADYRARKHSEQEQASPDVPGTDEDDASCPRDISGLSQVVPQEEKRRELTLKPLTPPTPPRALPSPRGDGGRSTRLRQKQFDETFWPDYPNKQGKEVARRKWVYLSDQDRIRASFVAKAMAYSVEQGWKDPKLCPYGSTFISQRRWEDWFDEDGQPVVPLDYQRSNGHLQAFFSVITKAGDDLDWEEEA